MKPGSKLIQQLGEGKAEAKGKDFEKREGYRFTAALKVGKKGSVNSKLNRDLQLSHALVVPKRPEAETKPGRQRTAWDCL